MKKGTKKLLNLGLLAFITGIVFILSAYIFVYPVTTNKRAKVTVFPIKKRY